MTDPAESGASQTDPVARLITPSASAWIKFKIILGLVLHARRNYKAHLRKLKEDSQQLLRETRELEAEFKAPLPDDPQLRQEVIESRQAAKQRLEAKYQAKSENRNELMGRVTFVGGMLGWVALALVFFAQIDDSPGLKVSIWLQIASVLPSLWSMFPAVSTLFRTFRVGDAGVRAYHGGDWDHYYELWNRDTHLQKVLHKIRWGLAITILIAATGLTIGLINEAVRGIVALVGWL